MNNTSLNAQHLIAKGFICKSESMIISKIVYKEIIYKFYNIYI